MTDANQSFGQNVDQESAEKLFCGNSHDLLLAAVGIILPSERHSIIPEANESMVGDRDAVGSLAYQVPGHPKLGDIFPPAEMGLKNAPPPWYVIVTMRPTLEGTFNKMVAFIAGYAAIFSPGVKVPNFSLLLEDVCPNIVTLAGYQYNLAGELKPVPRQYYADRYLPPLPMRIEDNHGELLSTVEFIPWQDGGVVLLQGRLPLEGILVFLGKEALSNGGVIKPAPGLQLSYVLPKKRRGHLRPLSLKRFLPILGANDLVLSLDCNVCRAKQLVPNVTPDR